MTQTYRASTVARANDAPVIDRIVLDYDARMIRRKRLITEAGHGVLVDLAETVSLDDGDALVLADGARVAICAAPEPLLIVRGPNLARLAWHIGNRHTPCHVALDHLLIRFDPVLRQMLQQLGAEVRETTAPFVPEGGAYGHGRTLGHSHGPHDHSHGQDHAHSHDHDHSHDPSHGHTHGPSHG